MVKQVFIRFCVIAILLGVFNMNAYAGDTLSISAVGDIMMGSTYPIKVLPPDDGRHIFDNVKGIFKACDIVFGNLEGPLTDRGKPSKCKGKSKDCYEFRTPSRYVRHLKDAGFNVLNIANNHSLDFGMRGIENTIKTLNSAGIKAVGGTKIAYMKVKGKRIAVIGFSFSDSPYSFPITDIEEAGRLVSKLKETNDIVIVSFHGGGEGRSALHISDMEEIFLNENRGNVVRFSRTVIDSGADVVIGHGPHVLRAMELYKGKLIVYSLGNFMTYGMFNIKGPNGLSVILKAEIDSETGDFVRGKLVSLRLLNRGVPEIDPEGEAVKLIKGLAEEDLGNPNIVIAESGELIIPTVSVQSSNP